MGRASGPVRSNHSCSCQLLVEGSPSISVSGQPAISSPGVCLRAWGSRGPAGKCLLAGKKGAGWLDPRGGFKKTLIRQHGCWQWGWRWVTMYRAAGVRASRSENKAVAHNWEELKPRGHGALSIEKSMCDYTFRGGGQRKALQGKKLNTTDTRKFGIKLPVCKIVWNQINMFAKVVAQL